jgi:Zn-dependent peptidase ImmA (M78 family)/DNA-binding XRE family transcriptional regulator
MERNILNNIDPKNLGAQLQEARKARGLTQQAVADQLGMARTTVVAIEKGERRVTPHELIQFAGLYGRSVSEFVSNRVVVESFVPQFRSGLTKEAVQDTSSETAAETLQRLAEDYAELERLCRMPMPKSYPPQYDASGRSPEQAAEEVATLERNRLGIGDGPLSNLRARLENDVGLRIFYFPMPPKIAGLFAYNDILGGCIGINSDHPRDRRNYSLAHEYGHFLTNRYQIEITLLTETKRNSAKERFADGFAKFFLMPANSLNRRFSEIQKTSESGATLAHILTLANLYQVSVQALILRLEEMRRLQSGTWDGLVTQGFKVREAQRLLGIDANPPVIDMLPMRYKTLAVRAYNEGQLSEGQLAKMLRTDRVSARVLVDEVNSRINTENEGEFKNLPLDLASPLGGK